MDTSQKLSLTHHGDVLGVVGEPTVVPSIHLDIHGEDLLVREKLEAISSFVF